jgi:hypothetical protein
VTRLNHSTEDGPPIVMLSRIARSIFPNPLLMTSVPSLCVATNIRNAK